ncbi:MAG: hypothetical protein ACOC5D_01895 [Thermoplasmatota archaeon]
MAKTVVICGGHARFQSKAKDFIKNSNEEIEIETFDLDTKTNELQQECDHFILYRERNINLEGLLNDLEVENEIILVGDIKSKDKTLAHNFGISNFIYIPECTGNQLDPYIREIEKSIHHDGDILGF